MSILKEGFGCSDDDLFEKCEFDLLARKALGLEMLDDKLPSRDTYYLFGRRLTAYEQETGINLMERCFEQVTGEQTRYSRYLATPSAWTASSSAATLRSIPAMN